MQALSQLSYGPTRWKAGKFNERSAGPSSNSVRRIAGMAQLSPKLSRQTTPG
jgi:hypothetical protein